MSKIITGVSTDKEFLDAINSKGASLTEKATPFSLAEAIDATGGNVSFLTPNEEIIEAVNSEVAPVGTEIILAYGTYEDSGLAYTRLVNENVTFPEEYWTLNTGDNTYDLNDPTIINATIDGNATDYVGVKPVDGFGNILLVDIPDGLSGIVAKYGPALKDCPFTINVPEGLFMFDGEPSAPVELDVKYGTPTPPNFIEDEVPTPEIFTLTVDFNGGTYKTDSEAEPVQTLDIEYEGTTTIDLDDLKQSMEDHVDGPDSKVLAGFNTTSSATTTISSITLSGDTTIYAVYEEAGPAIEPWQYNTESANIVIDTTQTVDRTSEDFVNGIPALGDTGRTLDIYNAHTNTKVGTYELNIDTENNLQVMLNIADQGAELSVGQITQLNLDGTLYTGEDTISFSGSYGDGIDEPTSITEAREFITMSFPITIKSTTADEVAAAKLGALFLKYFIDE